MHGRLCARVGVREGAVFVREGEEVCIKGAVPCVWQVRVSWVCLCGCV
jgi:hypothetical protein